MQRHSNNDQIDGLIGSSCEVSININGISTQALLDTGSTVSTMSYAFYKEHLTDYPIHPIENMFNLRCANGGDLPYSGYVEAEVDSTGLPSTQTQPCLFLIVDDTVYKDKIPIIIGTNIIQTLKDNAIRDHGTRYLQKAALHTPWFLAFRCLNLREKELEKRHYRLATIRSAESSSVIIPPNSDITIQGFMDKCLPYPTTIALIQATHRSAVPCDLDITPSIVTYQCDNKDVIPINISNISTRTVNINPKSLLCELQPVSIEETHSSINNNINNTSNDLDVDIEKENLTSREVMEAQSLLREYDDIFSKSDTDVGFTSSVFHRIDLTNNIPFKQKNRRIPPGMYEEVRNHLQQLLSSGIIRKSRSPWSSNIVLCRKKDGKLRMCVDYRQLNQRTVKDNYALPRIDEILEALQGNSYFTVLDMKAGYHQISVFEEHKQRTAFTVGPLGFYEYNRMPFGLVNAPATYQRLMEDCFDGLNLNICYIYLDDLIIFSKTYNEHIDRLRQVFDRIRTEGLKLSPSKCNFFKSKVKYVGHIVSTEGLQPDPAKIEKVLNWPQPKTPEEVRKFLGFIGYYRKFIKDFAKIARPLNDLMPPSHQPKKKKKPTSDWNWTSKHQESFDLLKTAVSTPPVLGFPDFNEPFELHTDACGTGLGAVLYQHQDGANRVISYASRSLSKAERNYPAHKLEFLALKWAITEKYKDYLLGHRFIVFTDNNPLTYVLTSAKLDATSQRWVAALSSYDFDIKYRNRKSNVDADCLSRLPQLLKAHAETLSSETIDAVCHSVDATSLVESISTNPDVIEALRTSDIIDTSDIVWQERQNMDNTLRIWKQHVKSGRKPKVEDVAPEHQPLALVRNFKHLSLQDNTLYRKVNIEGEDYKQLVIPKTYINTVLQYLHDKVGHPGRERTLSLIRDRFYWAGMANDIEHWIKNCKRCIHRKTTTQRAPLTNIRTSFPLELVCMDYLTLEKSGTYQYILVITDHFTRLAQAIPTRNMTARTTAQAFFDNFITYYGIPYRIHSDQGGSFEAKIIQELCEITGMTKSRTTPYHPMSNGMTEKYNRTLLDMLGTLQPEQKSKWKDYVRPLIHAYNCIRHESTGHSPYFLMFGREPHLPIDLLFGITREEKQTTTKYVEEMKQRMKKAYELVQTTADKARHKQKQQYDMKAKEVDLQEGDKVLVKVVAFEGKHKIADRWEEEPYVILRQMNNNIPVYEVKKLHGKGRKRILHRNLLLPIGHLPAFDTDHKEKEKEKPDRLHQRQDKRADTNTHLEDEYHSDTDSDSGTIIGEVPAPHQTDHIPLDVEESVSEEEEEVSDNDEPEVDGSVDQEESTSETASSQGHESDGDTGSENREDSRSDSDVNDTDDPPLRRSARDRKPPQWMGDYVVHSMQEEQKPPWKEKVDYLKDLLDTGQCKGRESEIVSAIISIVKS